jgi:hypothetical protein
MDSTVVTHPQPRATFLAVGEIKLLWMMRIEYLRVPYAILTTLRIQGQPRVVARSLRKSPLPLLARPHFLLAWAALGQTPLPNNSVKMLP